MKKALVGFGLCTALIAGISIGVYAQSNIKEIKAFLNSDIKLTMDGEAWTPTDADGNELSPIIYEGSSYLPLKAVAQAAGLQVDWNDSTKTIAIERPSAENGEGVPYKDDEDYGDYSGDTDVDWTGSLLGDLAVEQKAGDASAFLSVDSWNKFAWNTSIGDPFQMDGEPYYFGIGVHMNKTVPPEYYNSGGVVTYQLDGAFHELQAFAGIDDSVANSKGKATLVFVGDGKELLRTGELRGGQAVLPVTVDVSGVQKLEIHFLSDRQDNLNVVLGDAELVP